MKIGDKVRFVSETGGGIVSGFRGKDIVLVEDEDGFDIPEHIKDVVVVDDSAFDKRPAAPLPKPQPAPATPSASALKKEKPVKTEVYERSGGDKLCVFLAFLPLEEPGTTQKGRYEIFLINDCNYFISFSYMTAIGTTWTYKGSGEVEPNTQMPLGEITLDEINEMGKVAIQLIGYKKNKPFMIKQPVYVEYRLDPVKFFKKNSFRENDFFDEDAMIFTVIENDRVVRNRPLDVENITIGGDVGIEEKKASPRGKAGLSNVRLVDGKIVVDLHADKLIDDFTHLTSKDILDRQMKCFHDTLEEYKKKKGQQIIFIHGKGDGVLRHSIIHELNYKYKTYNYQDASFREFGYGATQVTIR